MKNQNKMFTALLLILATLLIIGCNTTKRHRQMNRSSADSSIEQVEKSAEKTVLESSSNTQIETTKVTTDRQDDDSNLDITFNESGGSVVIATDNAGLKTISAVNVKAVRHKQLKSTSQKDTSFSKASISNSNEVHSEKERDSREEVQTKITSKAVSNSLSRTKTPWYFWLGVPLFLILVAALINYIKRKRSKLQGIARL